MSALWIGAWGPAEDGQEPEQETAEEETFDSFALGWLEKQRASGGRNGDGLSESGEQDLAWCLDHLRAWFGGLRLSEISTEEVERFVHAKRTSPARRGRPERGDAALRDVRPEVRPRAPLDPRGRGPLGADRPRTRRRASGSRPRSRTRTSLDSADAISALLAAAGEIDAERKDRRGHGRPLLAMLVYGGSPDR